MKAMAKQRVALEVLSYHSAAPLADVHRLKVRTARTAASSMPVCDVRVSLHGHLYITNYSRVAGERLFCTAARNPY